jgi:hypothetical protein
LSGGGDLGKYVNMTNLAFDPIVYVRAPIITLESGIALARALVLACPAKMPALVQHTAEKLTRTADAAQAALGKRQGESTPATDTERKTLDGEADQAWGALRQRLEAYAGLPTERFPQAARAREILHLLFGEGTAFLRYSYAEQYVTMDTLLKRVEVEHLTADIDRLCGAEFLEQIRHVHPRYGAMVQRSLEQSPEGENQLFHVRALSRGIVEYAISISATVDTEKAHNVEQALNALRPIDVYREQAARREAGAAS